MRILVLVAIGCGSSTPPPTAPPVVVAADAAIADAPAPDAGVPEAVMNAPAWIFRYSAPGRLETWTLRYSGANALVTVERANGTTRYIGTVDDLVLTLAAGPNQLTLECKPAKLPVGATCGDKHPKQLDVLDCFHPDFKAPMTFGAAPGVEYVVTDACSGYVHVAP
jgi:hypothetical protein